MISLGLIRATNTKLVDAHPLVAVFVGAASGIGEFSVRALAAAHGTHGKGLRLYLVARKEAAAKKILTGCLEVCPSGQFIFVKADDLSLLKNVDEVSAKLIALEEKEAKTKSETARIDFLVMCQGIVNFGYGRQGGSLIFVTAEGIIGRSSLPLAETTEGLDITTSLLYYSRMRFILQLLPLLLTSSLPAHVVSVLGPGTEKKGRENKIWPDDLSLRDPSHYGFINMGNQIAYMKTFFLEYVAKKYPGKISLIHYFPGLVITDAFRDKKNPRWFRWSVTLLRPILGFVTVAREETGERVLFLASERFPARAPKDESKSEKKRSDIGIATSSDDVVGGGAYRVIWTGERIPTVPAYEKHRKDGLPEICVNHTLKAFEEIEAGRVFKD